MINTSGLILGTSASIKCLLDYKIKKKVSSMGYSRLNASRLTVTLPVFLPRKITSVENPNTSNLNHKHGSPQYVSGIVAPEFDTVDLLFLMVVDQLNSVHAFIQMGFVVEWIIYCNIAIPPYKIQMC